jgi:hypothetical protein
MKNHGGLVGISIFEKRSLNLREKRTGLSRGMGPPAFGEGFKTEILSPSLR